MSVFSLKDTINRINNPSSDGIFEYGYYDVNTLAFTRFDTYGYLDGSPVDYNNFDFSKILAWYKSGIEYPHIAFENLQGNASITPQPFPTNGIYMHASKAVLGFEGKVGVRINVPYNATFRFLSGSTVQGADTACGDNIGFQVKLNNTDVIPRMVLPHSSNPTPFNTALSNITTSDVIDIIVDNGDAADNPFCDDTSLAAIIEFIPATVPTPVLRGTLLCSSTTGVIYDIPLQTEGNVDLYKVGTTLPIATTPIVQNGYSGSATFNGLDLTAGGEFYVIAKNTGQIDSAESTHIVVPPCCNNATFTGNTTLNNGQTEVPYSQTLSLVGTAPFSLDSIVKPAWMTIAISGSSITLTGTPQNGDAVSNTPISFNVVNACSTLPFSQTISVIQSCEPILTTGIVIQSSRNPAIINENITFTISGITGTAPHTYTWSTTNGTIISGQGTSSCIISFSDNSVVSCTVTNCNGVGTATTTYNQTIRAADAVNDNVGNKPINVEQTYDISVNDTLCNGGESQFELIVGSEINCIVHSINVFTGVATYTPIGQGPFSFRYELRCNALLVDSATVSGIGVCSNVTADYIVGNINPIIGDLETYSITPSGTPPFIFNWVADGGLILSGQGTNTIVVQWHN